MSKIKEASFKTVKKWEKEFQTEFDYDIVNGKVSSLRCSVCKRWEKRIKNLKNFSAKWINPGATTIDKDCIKTYCQPTTSRSTKVNKKECFGWRSLQANGCR